MFNYITPRHGTEFHRFSDFLPSYKFPWISVSFCHVFFFSERLFLSISFVASASWPGLVFFLCLHLREVCMSGILKTDTASRLCGGHTGILFNVVLDGWHLFIEHGMPLMI
jgi:hypothetical protein